MQDWKRGGKSGPGFGTGVWAFTHSLRGDKVALAKAEAWVTVSLGFSAACQNKALLPKKYGFHLIYFAGVLL